MVVLKEEVDIPAPYEKLADWIGNFEKEFVRWSPYHIECQLFDGGCQKGAHIRFREIVMRMDYDITGTIVESDQDKDHFRIVFESNAKSAFITFEGKRLENGCRFSHTEAFGLKTPVIGVILNFLIFKVIFRRKADWNVIREDMILDNQYLTDILVHGKYPVRIPTDELMKDVK